VAAHGRAKLRIDRVLHLDGQIADAAARVQNVGLGKRLGGTGVETGAARAADVGLGNVLGEVEVGDEDADEEP
jgi:hypothetical protein